MPNDHSGKKSEIGHNIAIEESSGKPKKQAIAIALNMARKDRVPGAPAAPKKRIGVRKKG
jgi:hypothetical protein